MTTLKQGIKFLQEIILHAQYYTLSIYTLSFMKSHGI